VCETREEAETLDSYSQKKCDKINLERKEEEEDKNIKQGCLT